MYYTIASVWTMASDQGARWDLRAANYVSRINFEGSDPGGTRPVWGIGAPSGSKRCFESREFWHAVRDDDDDDDDDDDHHDHDVT